MFLYFCLYDVFFDSIITSESVGISKPQVGIFEYAINKMSVLPEHSIMIGDDPSVDLETDKAFGITDIWFNPNKIKKDYNHKNNEVR